jgi:hypothetical protein
MRRIVTLAAAGLLAGGCGQVAERVAEQAIENQLESEGGGDVDINIDSEGSGEVVIESDDGSTNINVGGGEIPDELTIPLYDGYDVLASTVAETNGETYVTVSLEYPESDLDGLVEFYEDYFADLEDTFTNQSSSDGVRSWTWSAADFTTGVTVSAFDGQENISVGVTQTG